MGAAIKADIKCDHYGCDKKTEMTFHIVGKNVEKLKLRLSHISGGWWSGVVDSSGYGYGKDEQVKYACPIHIAHVRGY